MNPEYQEITCEEFNEKYGTELKPEMTYYDADTEICNLVDECSFYMDMQPEAPIDYMKDMHDEGYCDIERVSFWHIADLQMYLAIMQE